MAKKKTSVKKPAQNKALHLTILIFGSFLLLIGLSVFFQIKNPASAAACANSLSCINDLSGKKEATNEGVFEGKHVIAQEIPMADALAMDSSKAVLGATTGGDKHIYVDLSTQKLYAYQGNQLVYSFLVSTGKWHPTPTGDFRIWVWLRYTRMRGGDQSKGTYYDLPNVPYTMFFYNSAVSKGQGYSLHGAYWHNNFGHVMSHGCVNMKPEEAAKIFYWTNPLAGSVAYPTSSTPGTLITIYGSAPAGETAFID
jgi:hypothetical protein